MDAGKGVNLGETLKRLPGVTTLNTGATISKPVIQGLHQPDRHRQNSVVLEGQQWGSEHAPEIDPFSADKITVVKGAAGVRYGVGAERYCARTGAPARFGRAGRLAESGWLFQWPGCSGSRRRRLAPAGAFAHVPPAGYCQTKRQPPARQIIFWVTPGGGIRLFHHGRLEIGGAGTMKSASPRSTSNWVSCAPRTSRIRRRSERPFAATYP